jgi:hypothetical protein
MDRGNTEVLTDAVNTSSSRLIVVGNRLSLAGAFCWYTPFI